MKKIIFALVLLLAINGSSIKAGTNEDFLITAARATIEKTKMNGTGFTFITQHQIEDTRDITYQTSTTEDMSSVSILSNMRAQAELSYSNNGSYGKTTSSCYDGMYKTDLKSLVTSLSKYTKSIRCAVKTTKLASTWAVTTKIQNGSFWCVDSNGNYKVVGALLSTGSTSCDKASKAKTKTIKEKSTFNHQTTLYPKSNGNYDAYFVNSVSMPSKSVKNEVVVKDGVTYQLLNSSLLADSDFTAAERASFLNKYIAIPTSTSVISTYYSITPKKINDLIDVFIKSGFTAQFSKTNADGSQVYTVTVPLQNLSKQMEFIIFLSFDNHLFKGLNSFNEKTISYNVTVKDNIISTITTAKMLTTKTGKDSYTMAASHLTGSVSAIPANSTLTCNQLWSFEKMGGQNVCDPISAETIAADKKKGEDAAIKSILSNMRAQAELFYSNMNDYGPQVTNCESGMFSSPAPYGMSNLVSGVKSRTNDVVCKSDKIGWFVSAKLVTGPWYCVDSTGGAGEITSQRSLADTRCK